MFTICRYYQVFKWCEIFYAVHNKLPNVTKQSRVCLIAWKWKNLDWGGVSPRQPSLDPPLFMDVQYTHLDKLNGNLVVFSGLSHECVTFYLKIEFCLMEQNGFSFWGKTDPILAPLPKWKGQIWHKILPYSCRDFFCERPIIFSMITILRYHVFYFLIPVT